MRLVQDEYDNASGSSLNGKVHVEVTNSCHVDEVPVLVGNTTRLQLALLHGRVTVQVCVMPNDCYNSSQCCDAIGRHRGGGYLQADSTIAVVSKDFLADCCYVSCCFCCTLYVN